MSSCTVKPMRNTDTIVCVCVCAQAAAAEEKPTWSVLRDDFMMGAAMKDWDKDSDGEEADTHTAGESESG